MIRNFLCLLIVLCGVACLNSGVLAQPSAPSPIETTRALQEFVNEMRTLQVTLRHSIAMAQRAQMVAMQISLQEDRIERLTRHIAARRKDLSSSMEISELQLDIENLENLLKEAVETQERIRLTARLELERKRKQLRDDITAQIEADIQRLENKRQQEQDRLSDLQRDAIAIQREVNDYLRETQRKP